jgi:hypothetical protein
MSIKIATIVAVIVGALPLLIYPIVLLAGVMSLAGESQGDEPALLMIVAKTFLWSSLAYPLVYGGFALAAAVVAWRPQGERLAFGLSCVPLAYLVMLGVLMFAWAVVEQLSV